MKTLIGLVLLASFTGNVHAKEQSQTVKVMAYFLNTCWEGRFVGSDATDVHCFRAMVNGHFVRDNHIVNSKRGTSGGETVFWWNKEKQQIQYTYWDSHGAISHGSMRPGSDGFVSPDETYQSQDGGSITIRTRWLIQSQNEYVMESVKVDGDKAERMFAIEYKRAPLKDCPGPNCDY